MRLHQLSVVPIIAASIVVALSNQAVARNRAPADSFHDEIRGSVRSPTGGPVEAWISVSFKRDTGTVILKTKTAFEGRFIVVVPAPAPSTYTIHVSSTGLADTTFTVRANTGPATTPDSGRVTLANARLRLP